MRTRDTLSSLQIKKSSYGSFFLWVRDVRHLYFTHTSKFLASKIIKICTVCVGAIVFPWQTRKERRRRKNPLKYFNFFIAWVRDAFVTSILITFGYFFFFLDKFNFPIFIFLVGALSLSYSTHGRKVSNSNNVFHGIFIFLKILLKIFKCP